MTTAFLLRLLESAPVALHRPDEPTFEDALPHAVGVSDGEAHEAATRLTDVKRETTDDN
jgi:hypothetical protein